MFGVDPLDDFLKYLLQYAASQTTLYEYDLKYIQWPCLGGQTPMAIVIRPKATL